MPSRNNPTRVTAAVRSRSDWVTMQFTAEIFEILNVPHHVKAIPTHRTLDKPFSLAESAEENGYQVIIAGVGDTAHLPGVTAAKVLVSVLGMPVRSVTLNGVDSLCPIAQMSCGIPMGALAIGKAGAANVALLVTQILATHDKEPHQYLNDWRRVQADEVLENPDPRDAV